jgi:hypothetical protein
VPRLQLVPKIAGGVSGPLLTPVKAPSPSRSGTTRPSKPAHPRTEQRKGAWNLNSGRCLSRGSCFHLHLPDDVVGLLGSSLCLQAACASAHASWCVRAQQASLEIFCICRRDFSWSTSSLDSLIWHFLAFVCVEGGRCCCYLPPSHGSLYQRPAAAAVYSFGFCSAGRTTRK